MKNKLPYDLERAFDRVQEALDDLQAEMEEVCDDHADCLVRTEDTAFSEGYDAALAGLPK